MAAEGFGIVPNWLVRESDLSAYGLLVYVALSGRANRRGEAWPSIATIAKEARCSRTTARKALEELRAAGLVSWQSRTVEGRSSTNVYRIWVGVEGKWGSVSRTLPLRQVDPPPPPGGPEEDTLKKTQLKKTHPVKPTLSSRRASDAQLTFLRDCLVMLHQELPAIELMTYWREQSSDAVDEEIKSLWPEIEEGGHESLRDALRDFGEELSEKARAFIEMRLSGNDYRDKPPRKRGTIEHGRAEREGQGGDLFESLLALTRAS